MISRRLAKKISKVARQLYYCTTPKDKSGSTTNRVRVRHRDILTRGRTWSNCFVFAQYECRSWLSRVLLLSLVDWWEVCPRVTRRRPVYSLYHNEPCSVFITFLSHKTYFLVPDKVQRDKNEERHWVTTAPSGVLPCPDELLSRRFKDDWTFRRVCGGLECAVAEDQTAARRRKAEAFWTEEYVEGSCAAG